MIQKEYTKTGRSCRVKFAIPPERARGAERASVVGDFNDWDKSKHAMKKSGDGGFSTTISLKPGQEYRFRYVLDGERWENDEAADAYAPNEHGGDDSVVRV